MENIPEIVKLIVVGIAIIILITGGFAITRWMKK